jgi:hypothetical protein
MVLVSRRLFASLVGGAAISARLQQPCFAGSERIRFLADDSSFTFELPPRWVGVTAPAQERDSLEHLISVRAQQIDGAASLQAIVDGGSRGRKYGSSVQALGSLDEIANRLVANELLADEAAESAAVVSMEQTSHRGAPYYLVRYQIGQRPAAAKLTVLQQRLYCIRIKAAKPAPTDFFDQVGGSLLADMEAILESYYASPVNYPCLEASNKQRMPSGGLCQVLRP